MAKLYLFPPCPNIRLLPFLEDPREGDNRLFQHIPRQEFDGIFTIVDRPPEAEYLLVPHYLTDLRAHGDYVPACLAEAREAGKRALLFTNQDDPAPLYYPYALILRPSAYRSTLLDNEMMLPGQVEDLGRIHGWEPLPKGEQPTVGFVGKAGFLTVRDRIRYCVRNYVLRQGSNREGLYLRRKALALVEGDARLVLTAKVRKQFSASRKTIELSPEEARRDYVSNMQESLFTLAPRGDGNYSLRFYETLALGRIPVLIDTDMQLPLEDRIDYEDFIIRIPYQKLHELPERVYRAWANRTDEELRAMQQKAREAFERYLYMPAFLRAVFTGQP